MRCSGCSAEAWVGGTGSLLNGECHVCAVSRANKAEARVKELEQRLKIAEEYQNEINDSSMWGNGNEDESRETRYSN